MTMDSCKVVLPQQQSFCRPTFRAAAGSGRRCCANRPRYPRTPASDGRRLPSGPPRGSTQRRRQPLCTAALPDDVPSSTVAVADWAAVSFKEAAGNGNLTKACLLVALEEEAAAQAAYAAAEGLEEAAADALRGSMGSASTWSLERMQALAEEATRAFYARLQELGVADAVLLGARSAPDSTLLTLHLDVVRGYPTQLIDAVNTILYQRHGYRRQRRHGDPADSRLSAVLESGNGSPASLAVLYLELCGRLGLELQPVALEGGRYFVLLPADEAVGLRVGGQRLVVDPYSQGMLLSEAEVRELFEVEGELQPCPPADVLSGVLGCLRDAHWCAAVGCPPEPLFAVPISLEVALGNYNDVEVEASSGEDEAGEYFTVRFSEPAEPAGGGGHGAGQQWWPARAHSLQRALAAARKIAWLRPKDLAAQLELGLLLFFDAQYDEAWQELGCVLEAAKRDTAAREAAAALQREEGLAQLEAVVEKARLMLVLGEGPSTAGGSGSGSGA